MFQSEEDFHGFTEREIKLSKKELKSRKEKLQKAIKKVRCRKKVTEGHSFQNLLFDVIQKLYLDPTTQI